MYIILFMYLNIFNKNFYFQGENPDIDNVDDLNEFQKTHESFKLLGFSESDIEKIYRFQYLYITGGRGK